MRKLLFLAALVLCVETYGQYSSRYYSSPYYQRQATNEISSNTVGLISLGMSMKKEKAEKKFKEGLNHLTGVGAIKDTAKAIKLIIEAADGGNDDAQMWLGKEYYYGEILERDYKKSEKYFRKITNWSFRYEPFYYLGMMYSDESKLGYKFKKASNYFKRATHIIGDLSSDANYQLGLLLLKEKKGEEGADYIAKAASRGHAQAQFLLGKMYLHGDCVKANKKEAKEWLERAARKDVAEAKELLKKEF